MSYRIVIAGQSQCSLFCEICLVADYLAQNLPSFCYERIEKSMVDWQLWLIKLNKKNNWFHNKSPIVWKELLLKGSKPYYIGGAPEFWEYCHSYYRFETFLALEKYSDLASNFSQFQKKIKSENVLLSIAPKCASSNETKTDFTICITGAGNKLTVPLVSGLLEMSVGSRSISKIFLHDNRDNLAPNREYMDFIETETSYVTTKHPGKVVKYVDRIGVALTHTDLLIVLDYKPFSVNDAIGDWLHGNKLIMTNLASTLNATASRHMCILFPNIGPACYNATILAYSLINIDKNNVVVAASDLGLEISTTLSQIAEVPMRNIFCPPVWGFLGINHLVDVATTMHIYNAFEPYNRYTKVRNSTLNIGSLTPELRTMDYLMFFDESLWSKIAERKKIGCANGTLNKVTSVLDVVKMWILDPGPEDTIVSLGIMCNGSFGLTLNGIFAQPAKLFKNKWIPATEFLMPRDAQIKLSYLDYIANMCLKLKPRDFPQTKSEF